MQVLRFGAFDVALHGCGPRHQQLIESQFRVAAESLDDSSPVDVRMSIVPGVPSSLPDAALRQDEDGDHTRFVTNILTADLDRGVTPMQLTIAVDDTHRHVRHLDLYLRIVLNAVLRRLSRVRLHAAAVDVEGQASLFVGDKGAGKTTLCLGLAARGGTILGEDQIMVRRQPAGDYAVAGGDDLMRVTAKTEAHFFGALPGDAIEAGGFVKKELRAAQRVPYVANREVRLHRVFFPVVGEKFRVHAVTRMDALHRLTTPLLPIHRFADTTDRRQFVEFFAGAVRQAECYALTLSPDLSDLSRLYEFLSSSTSSQVLTGR